MYHDLLSLPSSPPGLQPTARRPVEPCINRHLPSPPPHCVAHIMLSHPWHCHYTITRLNYLNATVIILAQHLSWRRRHQDRTFAAQLPGGFWCGSCVQGHAMRAGVSTLSLTLPTDIFPLPVALLRTYSDVCRLDQPYSGTLPFRCTTRLHAHVEGICHVVAKKRKQ